MTTTSKAPKKKSGAATMEPPAQENQLGSAAPAALAAARGPVTSIDLTKVRFEPTNHRDPNPAEVKAKAESMAVHGLLQPIEVVMGDLCLNAKGKPMGTASEFFVVFGHQRVLAARMNGWTSIAGYVFEAAPLSLSDRLGRRALENLGHAPLTAVEECMAVAMMFERSAAEFEEDRINDVAAGLGRSARWVRDRMMISKLSGEARDLVACGRLTLGHAREIARLSDPALRDDLASAAARDEDGGRGRSIPDVRKWVIERLRSLKVVPWETGVPFAGKPACIGCPANSASNSGLFDGALDGLSKKETAELGGRLEEGLCTNPACFESKQRAVDQSIKSARERAEKKAKGAKGEDEKRDVVNSTKAAEFVKPASARRQIAKAVMPQSKEAKTPVRAAKAEQPYHLTPQGRFQAADRKWEDACLEAFRKASAEEPSIFVCAVLAEIMAIRGSDQDAVKVLTKLGPLLERRDVGEMIEAAARAHAADKHGLYFFENLRGRYDLVFGKMGVEIPPRPVLADFEKAETAPAKPKKKGKK